MSWKIESYTGLSLATAIGKYVIIIMIIIIVIFMIISISSVCEIMFSETDIMQTFKLALALE